MATSKIVSSSRIPLVTIAIPVFNEAKYIRQTIEAIIAQDYENIEIVISDNKSTDGTNEICQSFATSDKRISYSQRQVNVGVAANFIALQENIQGEYFMWAAGHDLWAPNFISECVALLESKKNSVLAFATGEWIDSDGLAIDNQSLGWNDTRGMHSIARFYTTIWGNMNPILGLIRTHALKQAKPFQSILGADLVILCELSLIGEFAHAINTSWSRRKIRPDETYQDRVSRYQSPDFKQIKNQLGTSFPILLLPIELIKVIARSDLSLSLKAINTALLLPTMLVKYIISK